jgi:hypothetical protein
MGYERDGVFTPSPRLNSHPKRTVLLPGAAQKTVADGINIPSGTGYERDGVYSEPSGMGYERDGVFRAGRGIPPSPRLNSHRKRTVLLPGAAQKTVADGMNIPSGDRAGRGIHPVPTFEWSPQAEPYC